MPRSVDDVFECVRSFAVSPVAELSQSDQIEAFEAIIDDLQVRIYSIEEEMANDK